MHIDVFPLDRLADLWAILCQSPEANFDDYGPCTLDAFEDLIHARLSAGGCLFGAWVPNATEGELVGAVGFRQTGPEWGIFEGIAFDQSVHGKGIARAAVGAVLERIWAAGVSKVSAVYFADNARIDRFLAGLGAVHEGYLRRQSRRMGALIDMRVAAIFKDR